MKIYRVLELPHGANAHTISGYDSEGIVYIRRDLPVLIQIVALIHEVGHHIDDRIGKFLFKHLGYRPALNRCRWALWNLLMEEKDVLICRKWMPR